MLTRNDKLSLLKTVSGETDDGILAAYLDMAGAHILRKAYPYRSDVISVPDKYAQLQVEIACYLLGKRGAEGESAHSENGISRTYESASVPESMLKQVIPYAQVIGA